MDPYDYDELYFDDGHYDDDPNPYHGDYSEEQKKSGPSQSLLDKGLDGKACRAAIFHNPLVQKDLRPGGQPAAP